MERTKQIFSFGCGHTFANHFVVIEAETAERCRELMFESFDCKWSMQYDKEKEGELIENGMRSLMHIAELPDMRLVVHTKERVITRL